MGLTIYYELTCRDESEDLIRDRLTQLHDKAITLPFENVSELEFMDEVATEELKTEVKRVSFTCAKCGKRLAIFAEYKGKSARCPVCSHVMKVP